MVEIFGDDADREITREDLHQMPYTERCIKEALRYCFTALAFAI